MEFAIAVVLSLVAVAFIGYPFYQSRRKKISFDLNHRAEELETRKSEIYAAIKDIEFDYQMGKLSEEDYEELKHQYRTEAVGLLKEIDQDHGVQPVTDTRATGINFCSQCGEPVGKSEQFCSNCGEKLA
jgi:hypothetical protein